MFETVGLNITILADMHIVNSLDVQFSLNNGIFQPHRISDNIPVYINRKPNHLPVVIKQLQKSIAKHIPDISSDETFLVIQYQHTQKHIAKVDLMTPSLILQQQLTIELQTRKNAKEKLPG